MGILSGNPQDEPMHYGEVFGTWTYLVTNYGCLITYQTFINHAGDDDLKRLLEEGIQAIKSENQQIEDLLKANGVALPPSPPERPVANLEDIPAGARFNDPEISAALAMDVAKGLVACSTIMGQSIREDIGAMFGQFHMNKASLGVKVLKLNKEKGWLVPPPLHLNTPNQE
ncbi:membrane protein [Siminovitchia terrae]|uniref:DUF3231 family protein n=1 Tax=Siminovitchia terrae TaxID=1914933 RepID=A0A429X240_SIMTE|nr:DUF3231 family protein [Siminovitchia terrae]RST57200.1 DUF3231 family protein [Siminovitchia terrae]GIN94249.1 membrane protein [Siminovitchia terrae]